MDFLKSQSVSNQQGISDDLNFAVNDLAHFQVGVDYDF